MTNLLLSDQVAERRFILRCSKWFMPYSVNPYGVSLILGLHKAHCWNYLMIPFLLIRPFFQSRGYGSGFIFQFLILAMALLGTGIVLLLAHNHLCLSPQYYRFGVFRLRSWVGLPTHFLCLSILSGNFEIMVLHLSPFLVPGDGSHCSNF